MSQHLEPYPELLLYARAAYFLRRISRGIRLRCYAPSKCTHEAFAEIGPEAGQARIESIYTALNIGTERAMLHRLPNTMTEFPYTPVSSGVGRVAELGKGVKSLRKGDIVAGSFQHASSQKTDGGRLIRIAPGVDLQDAALLHLCVIAIQAIRMGRIAEGQAQTVAVMGQGIIGRLATLLVRSFGSRAICITRSPNRLRQFQEKHGISLSSEGSLDRIKELDADVVIDATGDPEAIHTAITACRRNGSIVLLGSNRGRTLSVDPNGVVMRKGLSIIGAHIRNISAMPDSLGFDYQGEGRYLQELILDGRLNLADTVTTRLSCADLEEQYHDILDGERLPCGVLVDWSTASTVMEHATRPFVVPGTTVITERPPFRMALIGCGDIGYVNASAFSECNSVKLAGVMDTSLDRSRELGSRFDVPYTDRYQDVLENDSIDGVLIAVPHFLHRPLAERAAHSAKHVVVEKPLATTMEDAAAMIHAAREANILLRTFYPARFEWPIRAAKALVDHDAIGRLMGVSIEFHRYRPVKYWYEEDNGVHSLSWRGRREQSGGGFLIMYLVHAFDYVHYISGLEVRSVFADCATLWHPIDVEDSIGITFKGMNEEIGTVSSGSAVRGQGGSLVRMWGENGQIVLDGADLRFYSLRSVGEYPALKWHSLRTPRSVNERALFLDMFHKSVAEGAETEIDEPGYRSLAVVQAAYESARRGSPVEVSEFSAAKR